MPVSLNSRRPWLAATGALLLALPLATAWPAPFASTRISVHTEGSGPDVILIPGLSSSPRTWETTVKSLPGYRYHLVQVSGFAGQPAEGNKEGTVAAPVAEEIARYIRETGLSRPAVVGHSMGGTIGLMLAARHPDALSRLMVVDMFPFLGAMFGGPGATPASLKPVADRIADGIRNADPAQRQQNAEKTIAGMVNDPAFHMVAVSDSLASDPDVSARAYHELVLTDLRAELAKITVPVTILYVVPKGAPLSPEQIDGFYQASYQTLRSVTLKRIPDSAHFIMADQPARFQAELRTFLDAR